MKRFTSMFLAVCMLALPVSGCSQSSGAEASTSVASTASGDAAEEMITLTSIGTAGLMLGRSLPRRL